MNQAFRFSSLSLSSGLLTFAWVFTLLIPPATAQVNGPGTSPANLFDTVLNLPGDEFLISDDIGGIAGQTTQLNLSLIHI